MVLLHQLLKRVAQSLAINTDILLLEKVAGQWTKVETDYTLHLAPSHGLNFS